MNTNIGILQYIKSGDISIRNEISNIEANVDINIRVKQFLLNSPDYQKLYKEIQRKNKQVNSEINEERRLHLSQELHNLYQLQTQFKIDTLYLADTFSKLKVKTERLDRAKALFEKGNIKDANNILLEIDLTNDQLSLLIMADYLENITMLNHY